jgi:hypothetical protein
VPAERFEEALRVGRRLVTSQPVVRADIEEFEQMPMAALPVPVNAQRQNDLEELATALSLSNGPR